MSQIIEQIVETPLEQIPEDPVSHFGERPLSDFWNLSPEQRKATLLQAISALHSWHFRRNTAYRLTVSGRGIGASISEADLPRLLRPTAQTFKSYIDILGTPFPESRPRAFLEWLDEQLSISLPKERFDQFRRSYSSLEAFLQAIEREFSDFGLEFSTSSGTSGRSTIMVRDQKGIARTVESFYLCFQRYLGMQADHRAVFIMPRNTRITMVRMATFSVRRVWGSDERIHFTIPFPAQPDQVRIRTGRTYRPGWRGTIERKLLHPFMNWMNDHYVNGTAIRQTLALIHQTETAGEKLLLFGGWTHLHAIAKELIGKGKIVRLASGSLLGTGGGMKERYPLTPDQIRQDLAAAFELSDGRPVPVLDDYGMAEGNWAAMQCRHGNYHVPPWIYALTLDQDNRLQVGADETGLFAFFDPYGGGSLFPAFFKTADRVRLVNGATRYDPACDCPCGDVGAYIPHHSIQRVDLIDEAGCAAQL
jgi:hypothetical protein